MEYQIILEQLPQVNLLGHSICEPEWGLMNRQLPDAELVVVYSGVLCCEIEGRQYQLQEGDAVLIPPHALHSQYTERQTCRFFYIHFDVKMTSAAEKEAVSVSNYPNPWGEAFFSLPTPVRHTIVIPEFCHTGSVRAEIFTLFERSLLERNQLRSNRLLMISLNLCQTLLLVSRAASRSLPPDHMDGHEQNKTIQEALRYINTHYTQRLNIEALSDRLGISQQYLNRLFKQWVGMSPVRYINRLRVEEAKQQMRNSDRNISEIAYDIGFENIYYFSRVFKQYEGMPPTGYRRWLDSRSNE